MFVELEGKKYTIDSKEEQQAALAEIKRLGISRALVREVKTVLNKKFEVEIGYLAPDGTLSSNL